MYYLISEASELHIVTASHPDHRGMSIMEDADLDAVREYRDEMLSDCTPVMLRGQEMLGTERLQAA